MNIQEAKDVIRRVTVGWPVPALPHATAEVWAEALVVADYQLAKKAVNDLLREPDGRQPHVGQIIARAKELEAAAMGDGLPDEHQVVDYLFTVASVVGWYRWTNDFPEKYPLIRETFATQSWADRVCHSLESERGIVAAQIRDAWRTRRRDTMRDAAHKPAGSGLRVAGTNPARELGGSPSSLPAKREVGR